MLTSSSLKMPPLNTSSPTKLSSKKSSLSFSSAPKGGYTRYSSNIATRNYWLSFCSRIFGFHRNWFAGNQLLMFFFKRFPSSINASSGVLKHDWCLSDPSGTEPNCRFCLLLPLLPHLFSFYSCQLVTQLSTGPLQSTAFPSQLFPPPPVIWSLPVNWTPSLTRPQVNWSPIQLVQ